MPPLCSEKRCPQNIGRRSRVSSRVTRPTLLIGGGLEDKGDDADESDENISPDAEKSEISFTLERRGDKDGEDKNNNRKNGYDGNGRGRNRRKGDGDHGRRKGRGGNSNGTSRSRGGGDKDHRPPLHENDDGENGDGGRGHGRGSGSGKGGDDNDRGDNDNKGERGGRGGGGSDSDPNNNSSTLLPLPPPLPSTSTTSSVIETSSTTPVVISTSTSAPETMISSILQDSPRTTFTQLPALGGPSPVMTPNPIVPTTDPDRAVGDTQTSTLFTTTGVADPSVPAPTQTQTSPANSRGNAKGNHRGDGGNNDSNSNNNSRGHRGELNRTSERILVATGSIGGFIVFCFIVWIIYRAAKKSKQSSHRGDGNFWQSRLIPWRGRPATSNAQALTGSYEPKEPLPAYNASNNNSMEAFGYYDQTKLVPLDSENMAYPSAAGLPAGMAVPQAPEVQPSPPGISPNQYPQLGDQMIDGGDSNSTLQSRMPDPYYDQSKFARQPSDVYNPAPRQVDRASEVSSLSSGFGDGDIIIPPPNVMMLKTPTARPFSWMSQTGTEQQRDTVYTTTSERRFRSVNSWVDLQKKRMKRAG
ncbi:hypothetical protein ANO14919_021560 [Xylariales sp. No.14919]|nr:hypothetical protein ANO14919_021560 [Xylariales sp. No.14919]